VFPDGADKYLSEKFWDEESLVAGGGI